jgi:hypothetical protein
MKALPPDPLQERYWFETGCNMMGRKLTRGIGKKFAEAFKKSGLFSLYQNHNDELFIGVRNDYLNLYYNCDSIAKVEYEKTMV